MKGDVVREDEVLFDIPGANRKLNKTLCASQSNNNDAADGRLHANANHASQRKSSTHSKLSTGALRSSLNSF